MKKTIICTVLLALAMSSYSQQDNPEYPLTSQEYLKKSKDQKSTAWFCLATGTVLMGAGFLVAVSAGFDDRNPIVGEVMFGTGAFLDLLCIPLFISSGKNKKRGMEAVTYINIENIPPGLGNNSLHKPLPAVSLKVSF